MAVIPCTVKSSGYSDAKQEKLIRIKEDKEGAPNTNEDWAVKRQELQRIETTSIARYIRWMLKTPGWRK